MPMDKTTESLSLIQDKISDFILELERVKTTLNSSVDTFLKTELNKPQVKKDPFLSKYYSDTKQFLENLFRNTDFAGGLSRLNKLLQSSNPSLVINLRGTEDIGKTLNNFITEYGIVNFYQNDLAKIKIDLNEILRLLPNKELPSEQVAIFPLVPEPDVLEPAAEKAEGVTEADKPEATSETFKNAPSKGFGRERIKTTILGGEGSKEDVLAYNLNYYSSFFDRTEPSLKQEFEAKKKELKESLNIYQFYAPFSSLKNQDMIIYIDESITPPQIEFDQNVYSDLYRLVESKLDAFTAKLQEAYLMASASMNIGAAERSRYSISKELDDLISACKLRDNLIYEKYNELKADLSTKGDSPHFAIEFGSQQSVRQFLLSESFKETQTTVGGKLQNLIKQICFLSAMSQNASLEKMNFKVKAEKESSELTERVYKNFEARFNVQFTNKIARFFDYSRAESTHDSICKYMSSSISLSNLYLLAYNLASETLRFGWNYISCPTCNKSIYFSKYRDNATGESSKTLEEALIKNRSSGKTEAEMVAYLDPAELSDYGEERYSFFRTDGSLITTADLEAAGNWTEILQKLSSGNLIEHKEGVRLRQELLKSLGAKQIKNKRGENSDAVWSYKTKCPFSSGNELPPSLRSVKEKAESAGESLYVKDFSCGLSLDVSQIVNSNRKLDPVEIHSTALPTGLDPEAQLNAAITEAVNKNILQESDRDSFIRELNKRRSGGWKFSRTMFNCPCKPDLNQSSFDNDVKNYNYITSPISGFYNQKYIDNGIVHPPTDSLGNSLNIEDGTASFVVCGRQTSISAFCRDTTDTGSIYSILNSKLSEALAGNKESRKYIVEFIDTMLFLGVDFNDILPFIDKIQMQLSEKVISAKHREIVRGIIKEAIEMDVPSHDKGANLTRLQVLGDLKLVCSNGHRFKILDSIRFGQTHFSYLISKNKKEIKNLENSGTIFSSGYKNLTATTKLNIPGMIGTPVLKMVNKTDIGFGKKNFLEWDGRWDDAKGLSEYYYVDDSGNYYIFSKPPRSVAWGKHSSFESVDPLVERDSKTSVLLHKRTLTVGETYSASDSSGDQAEESYADKAVAENSKAKEIFRKLTPESLKDMNKKASLDTLYSPLGVMLQSILKMIEDYCNMSSSVKTSMPLYGTPVILGDNEEIPRIVESIIRGFFMDDFEANYPAADREEYGTEDDYQELVSKLNSTSLVPSCMEFFNKSYFDVLKHQDLRLLSTVSPSVSLISENRILRAIANSINVGIEKSKEEHEFDLFDFDLQTSMIFDIESNANLKDLFSKYQPEIDKIIKILNEKVELPKGAKHIETPSDRLSTGLSRMRGQELMGRVMMMSSALSLADSLSMIYLKYLDKNHPDNYIGIDIGLDLSSPNKIINLNKENGAIFAIPESSILAIPTSFPQDQYEDDYDISEDSDFVDEIIDNYYDEVISCINTIKSEVSKIQLACTNHNYMNKAISIINQSLVSKIQAAPISDVDRAMATSLVKNCIVTPPITTMSLSPGDKYHSYFAGVSDNIPMGGPYRLLPVFNAEIVPVPQRREYDPPVFLLSGSGVSSAMTLGIPVITTPPNKMAVLYKNVELKDAQPLDVAMPQDVSKAGWRAALLPMSKSKEEKISLFYHPFTLAVKKDRNTYPPDFDSDSIVGFINNFTKFDSTAGFSLGPISPRSGRQFIYPPPYEDDTHVGLFIPIKYPNIEDFKQSTVLIAPFFDAKIPVTLPTESPEEPISIDMSDLLMRDPPELAQKILREISTVYQDYKQQARRLGVISTESGKIARNNLQNRYKNIISILYKQYKDLPYRIVNSSSSTIVKYHGVEANNSAVPANATYIPMSDYVTCNKILECEEFSSEFGGHSFWSEGDIGRASKVKGSVKQMLIEANNLKELSELYNKELNALVPWTKFDLFLKIEPEELLDPHGLLFPKIYSIVSIRLKDKNSSISDSDIGKKTAEVIQKITAYNIGDEYVPPTEFGKIAERCQDPWEGRNKQNAVNYLNKKYRQWISSIGRSYQITSSGNGEDGQPLARLKVMNEIFPYNSDGSARLEEMKAVQDPLNPEILTSKQFYAIDFISGVPRSQSSYPVPSDAKELKAHLDKFKKVERIGATRYAEAISRMFVDHMITDLVNRIYLEQSGESLQSDVRLISKKAFLNLQKNLNIRVDHPFYVDNLRKAGIAALWSTFG